MTQLISDEEIFRYVKKTDNITLNCLIDRFNVSESTARRLLIRMEKAGLVRRYRGGAIPIPAKPTLYDQRGQTQTATKDSIAQKAAESVANGSSIILLGGTTVGMMCPYLYGKELSVITNSLAVFDQLKGIDGIRLIMLGGVYNHEEYELSGNVTAMGLRIMHADILFLSCMGFSPQVGFMTDHIDCIDFYRLCMKNANKTYMLADSAKAQKSGIAVFAAINEVDHMITDTDLSDDAARIFTELGLAITTV